MLALFFHLMDERKVKTGVGQERSPSGERQFKLISFSSLVMEPP